MVSARSDRVTGRGRPLRGVPTYQLSDQAQDPTDQDVHGQSQTHGNGTGDTDYQRDAPFVALKILVAGGFGVGKTTLVGSVSEIRPLRTEEEMTEASRGVDVTTGVERKHTTTVAMDFGRITIRDGLALYLFGTPGQDRFWFLWDELAQGALGAVVLADTRRLTDCFPAVDFFERRHIPFVVAVNCFDDARRYTPQEIGEALDLDERTPVLLCDARERTSGKDVLISLVQHASRHHAARRYRSGDTHDSHDRGTDDGSG